VLLLILIVVFLVVGAVNLLAGFLLLVTGLCGLGIWAFVASRRSFGARGGQQPMQLRIGPKGFGVRRGFGPVDTIPWRSSWNVRVSWISASRCTILVYRTFAASIPLQEALRFTTSMQADEAEALMTQVSDWIRLSK
jgi:hypothetical protein